jgi:hypothetical protein
MGQQVGNVGNDVGSPHKHPRAVFEAFETPVREVKVPR